MARKKQNSGNLFEKFSAAASKFTGSTPALIGAFTVIILWAVTGPVFNYSETWQLIINTGTTIITFIMVFLIQRVQNKDSLAIQLKLNEIIASIEGASNRLVNVEDISEDDLETLRKHYQKLAALFENEKQIKESHSIEEAENKHKKKFKRSSK